MTQDEILDPEVGNPNFELLFEDDSYSRGSNQSDKYLDSFYDSIKIEIPKAGDVVKGKFIELCLSNMFLA
jgi:hypothetical protein